MGHGVKLSEMAEKMQLKNLTPDVDLAEKEVTVPDVNRPALQLAGYFDHFDSERVQIIGMWNIHICRHWSRKRKKRFIRNCWHVRFHV